MAVSASSSSPSRLTCVTSAGTGVDRFVADRRDGLDAARACPAADPFEQILDGAELALDGPLASRSPFIVSTPITASTSSRRAPL